MSKITDDLFGKGLTLLLQIPLRSKHQTRNNAIGALDNDELKSDIFQIKTDKAGQFDLTLPVYHKGEDTTSNYKGLIVKISHKSPTGDKVVEVTSARYDMEKMTVSLEHCLLVSISYHNENMPIQI